MGANTTQRVQKHRVSLRAMGMRPIQIWVPDTRLPSFIAESQRQSHLAAIADREDLALIDFMDQALSDMAEA